MKSTRRRLMSTTVLPLAVAVAIGADGYSDDAPNAVGLARGLVA